MEKIKMLVNAYNDFYYYCTMENVQHNDARTLLKIHDNIEERYHDTLELLHDNEDAIYKMRVYLKSLDFDDARIFDYIYDNIINDVNNI